MNLNPKDLKPILDALDSKLDEVGESRELIICGGAALLILDIIERSTRDVDVVAPSIDLVLKEAAGSISTAFGLEADWLNNGPESLAQDLEPGWESRATLIYEGRRLLLKSLGRHDLIASKLFAMCDRNENDFDDLIRLNPTLQELEMLKEWLLFRDASEYWPARVEKCYKRLTKRLGYE